jgi:O-antigen/teichoic acid export membrane protein
VGLDVAGVFGVEGPGWIASDFEARWRTRTRRRYGGLATLGLALGQMRDQVMKLRMIPIARLFTDDPGGPNAFRAAAVALPFAAIAQTYLGATRGLKIMRHTLYVFWVGQWAAWIVLSLAVWLVAETVGLTVLAYAGSWALATAAAWAAWRKEIGRFPSTTDAPLLPEERTGALLRFGALRAPATLFAQLIFWTDFFVLSLLAPARDVGIYGAAIRAAQSLLLFLTSLSLVFSPFVADLHARGRRDQLDALLIRRVLHVFQLVPDIEAPPPRVIEIVLAGGIQALRLDGAVDEASRRTPYEIARREAPGEPGASL